MKESPFKDSINLIEKVTVSIETPSNNYNNINLDLGCGENKQKGFIGMDKRNLPTVDIVHDLEVIPYPLNDESVNNIVASHIIEHLKPWLTIDIFNEWWRILKVGGRIAFSAPYGVNEYFVQDPTHCNPINQSTFQYFDPSYPLYNVYKPKPFKILNLYYQTNGFIEGILEKLSEEEGKQIHNKMIEQYFNK